MGTQSTGNYLYIYYNTGTKTAPSFGSYNFLLNKGMFVSITNAAPELFDLDGDGVKDLISGNSQGEILYYHNSGTNDAMVLDDVAHLIAGGKVMKVDKYSQFTFCDWNNDGVTDMVVGDKNEKVMLFLGKGEVSVKGIESTSSSLHLNVHKKLLCFSEVISSGELVLYTLQGKKLLEFELSHSSSVKLPESLAEGFYAVQIDRESGSYIQKVYLSRN